MTAFPRLALLAAALYGAYGLQSPFLPALMAGRGLSPDAVGLVLAAATLAKLAAGPLAGHLADRLDATRAVLALAAVAAGLLSFAWLADAGAPGWSLAWFLALGIVHAVALAPLAPLADALTLAASERGRRFAYGRVRGVGSAAFILGTLAAGGIIAGTGPAGAVAAGGLLFLATAAAAGLAPPIAAREPGDTTGPAGLRALLAEPALMRIVAVAALVIGSHALNDAFAVVRWREAGLGPLTVSLLWSAAVAGEVAVFLVVGPPLVARLGAARCAMLAASAGIVRWGLFASTLAVPALALGQLLHGLTFALLHLAAMRVVGRAVPPHLAATAQTLYGTFGLGLASALLTAASGVLYARLGDGAYWAMAALCLLALPLAASLPEEKN